MQQVIIGLLVWQIILLPWDIDQKRQMWMQILSPAFQGEEHDQHIEADSVHALISQVAQGATMMEAYFCNIQVTETLDI